MTEEKEDYNIPLEKAIAVLPDGDYVHTFRNPAGILVGADWSKQKIIEAMKKYGVRQAGEQACNLKHSLVLKDNTDWLFIETKEKIDWNKKE